MIIIELSLIIVFAFVLRTIFIYLQRNISILGPGQNVVISIIMIVMLFNIVLMVGVVIFSNYHTEWQSIGPIGLQGADGQQGEKGQTQCIKKGTPLPTVDCPQKN